MKRATPVLLAALLVLSLSAVAAVAGPGAGQGAERHADPSLEPTAQPDANQTLLQANNTTNRLSLIDPAETGYEAYEPDAGMAFVAMDDALGIDQEQFALVDGEFEDASTEERVEMLENAYDRLGERIETLEDRERTAVREHAAGERTDAELMQTLMRNHEEANTLAERFDELDEMTDRVPAEFDDDESDLLDFHRTPVREDLESGANSYEMNQEALLIRTAEDGYSLATVDATTYTVETTRFDHREPDAPNQFDTEEYGYNDYDQILDYIFEYYDWAEDPTELYFSDKNELNLYWSQSEHDQGSLEVYLDGGTGEVHREVQELSLSELPVEESDGWSGDGVSMGINQTAANGPAEVQVVDRDDGDPVSATVTVDGEEVGETSSNGTIWILPPGPEYDLGAEAEDGEVNGTVSPD